MKADHFKDFKTCAGQFDYKKVPYSKVKSLRFSQAFFELEYKISFIGERWIKVNLKSSTPRTRTAAASLIVPIPKLADIKNSISAEKISAIKAMLTHMPEVDRQYYTAILKL